LKVAQRLSETTEKDAALFPNYVATNKHDSFTHKKDLQAVEQKRPEVRQARHVWITRRQPFMANLLPRIGFIDETSLKTNLAKTTGWFPKGARLIDHAPFGHWNTQTFIAALRHDRLAAPWGIDGAMNRELFELYVETQLVPTLQTGDVIILDNLSSHKSPTAADAMRAVGAWCLFRCSGKTPHPGLF